MMTRQRRQPRAEFKAKVALEAIRGERTINELAAEYGVHPVQITPGKKVVLEEVPTLFSRHRGAKSQEEEALKAALYPPIGPLKGELDWLKTNVGHLRCGETPGGRARSSRDQPQAPMRPVGRGPVAPVLSAWWRQRRRCGTDAVARRAIHRGAVLRDPPDDGVAAQPGRYGAP